MRIVWIAALVAGCGRFNFDPFGPGVIDANGDDDGGGPPAEAGAVLPVRTVGAVSSVTTDITIPSVTLAPGETLIVFTNRQGNDTSLVTWNGITIPEDEPYTIWGASYFTSIWSLYTATGGTGDLIAMGSSGTASYDVMASAVSGLLQPNATDATMNQTGAGTVATTGASGTTAIADELLYVAVAGNAAAAMTGPWTSGLTPNQSVVGATAEASDAWQLVSSIGNYTAGRSSFANQMWAAAIVTYKRAVSHSWQTSSPMTGPFPFQQGPLLGNACVTPGVMNVCSSPAGGVMFWHYATCTCV